MALRLQVILVLIACTSCVGLPRGQSFREYAATFHVPKSTGVPEVIPLPDAVYDDAIRLKQTDVSAFNRSVALILLRYHEYYVAHFRQGYSFVSPQELVSGEYQAPGNNKFFLIREFISASGIRPSQDDGIPSAAVGVWLESWSRSSR